MAEFVDLKLEEMIPELEQMQRVELFTEQEIKAVIKKRRDFEYKLQKKSKKKEDYLKYIQYEINLLTLVRLRREKTGYQFKKPEIDYAIANRINKLFMYVVSRFASDTTLWLSHLEFCKKMKWTSSISRIFVRLLAVKSNEPSLWIMAAKWEFEENSSATNGRALLLRALRFHPNNIKIYTEAFRLELLEADRLRKRRQVLGLSCEGDLPDGEEEKNNILDGKLAVLFYNDAKNGVSSAADLVPFLVVAKDFDFTQSIQETIINDMKTCHSDDEITWDTVARTALEKSTSSEEKPLKLKERIETCCSIYEEAVERLATDRMWQLYVDTLFVLHENEIVRPKIRHRIDNVCNRALMNKSLTPQQIKDWVDILAEKSFSGRELKTILEEAVKQYPKENKLWVRLVKIHLESKGEEEEDLFHIDTGADLEELPSADEEPAPSLDIPTVFWEAIKALGPAKSSIDVWETAIEHFESVRQKHSEASNVVEELYQKAMVVEPPVGNHFKPRYLSWIAVFKGRDEAYALYQAKSTVPPIVLDFYHRMANIELEQAKPNVKTIRKILDEAAIQFGQKDIEIWLRFIRFELEHGDATRVGTLHHRAKMALDPALADEFLVQYTLLQLKP